MRILRSDALPHTSMISQELDTRPIEFKPRTPPPAHCTTSAEQLGPQFVRYTLENVQDGHKWHKMWCNSDLPVVSTAKGN